MGSEILEQSYGSEKPQHVVCEDQPLDLADLEEGLKKLPSPASSGLDVEEEVCGKSIGAVASVDEDAVLAAKGVEQVDSFLREALNSRNRLTVLRLEQEVEKFMRNPKQQQLEFKPMPSSYVRLAAHRVAQHYHLQSMVVDCNSLEGSRIIARKTPESRFPDVRLVDIPVDPPLQVKSVAVPLENVAIKQRATRGSKANGYCNGAGEFSGRMNPAKSVEERKEEYNKARARIFSSGDLAGRSMEENLVLENLKFGESLPIAVSKSEEKLASNELHELVIRGGLTPDRVDRVSTGRAEDESALRVKVNANRVAIFRDREKDRKDPDYDRNYDRYSQRFDPGFGVNLGLFSMQAMYAPVLNYNSEFPQLDGSRQPQIHLERPSHLTPQHLGGPWVGSSGSSSFGHPDALFGHFTHRHIGSHSGSDIYLHSPRFPYPGAYSHAQEHFQQSFSQPHLQPEASFSEARRH